MTTAHEAPALSEKDQEIIAVGASIASGCLPCTKFHLRAASRTGAGEREILQAVRDATRVRTAATEIMARAGGLSSAEGSELVQDSTEARSLIRELVSIGAAYALACTTSLDGHLAAARTLGATDRQVFEAVRIACAIRDVACSKAKAVVGAALGLDEDRATTWGSTGDSAASAGDAPCCTPDTREGAGIDACVCDGGGRR
jgi:AhpD family alkylhydroperoxidase